LECGEGHGRGLSFLLQVKSLKVIIHVWPKCRLPLYLAANSFWNEEPVLPFKREEQALFVYMKKHSNQPHLPIPAPPRFLTP
jgi:hypothetical protein